MPIPAGVETVTVSSGEPLILPDGTPIQGRLLFTGPELVTIAEDDTIVCGTTEVSLADGEFSIELIATDATGMDPTGWTYKVTGQFSNAPNWVKYISLPRATASVNLSDVVAASSSSGTSYLISQTDADARYVNVSGDTMTGDLTLSGSTSDLTVGGNTTITGTVGVTGASSLGDVETTGPVVVRSVAGAPEADTLPLGTTAAAENHGLQIVSSFDGGEDNAQGTDSTGRISLYSYQRAGTHSFGEIQRMYLMRQDAKAMLAWYGAQLTGTQNHGYDANRDAETTGVSWKPWAWLGAHYEANDHGSTHGHISIEVPDTTGALQTRFEIQFADRATGEIGLDKSFIISNDADFAIRQSGGESFRIVAPAGTEKRIEFMGDAHGDSTTRRWKLRSTSTAESGSNAGSDFELVRYDDTGTAQSATFIVKRSNGLVGFGTAVGDIDSRITVRQDGTASAGKFVSTTEGTASTATLRVETSTTGKRAFDYRLTGDTVSRVRLDSSATGGGGTLTFGNGTLADVNLYRSAANILGTDDEFHVARSAATDIAVSTIAGAETFDRLRIRADGLIEIGPGSGSRDTNLYRGGTDLLKTDDKFVAAAGIGVGNSAAATALGSVTKKIEVFDATGASLGFVPVYDAIT